MPRLRSNPKQLAQPKGRSAAKATGNAAERAYQMIREEIILRLQPGAELDESEVLRKLGLSRTPVREAIARLAGERLVQLLPNKGARVAPAGWVEIREHLESLDVMQRLVTRWAAVRRTADDLASIAREQLSFEAAAKRGDGVALTEANWRFHTAIGASCRNSVFDRCYKQVLTEGLRIDRHAMFRDSFDTQADRDAHIRRIIEDHALMVTAISEGNADAAESAAKTHSDLARKRIGEALTGPLAQALTIGLEIEKEGMS